MAGRFVRSSKFRHVYGKPTRKEQCYDNLHISKNAWDSNIIKANPQYLSVNWESGGGGAFAVIPLSQRGRLPEQIPLFRGHTAPVLDTDWSPFNDSLIASGSDDGKIFIWTVPENFSLLTDEEAGPKDVEPISRLSGHQRKVGHVLFHPAADNVLATSSGDYTVKLWDISTGTPHYTLKHSEVVQSMSWSTNGSLLVTTCRDKKLRIWDPRQETAVHEVTGHTGAKNSRAVWMTGVGDGKIATTGFSKMSDRQLGLWDLRSLAEGPLNGYEMLDTISGVCMPFWDEGTKCIYLAGKGDGNIRYFEYSNDEFIFLSEYKSGDPQRGIAFLPKRGVAVHENEVMRAFKTVNDSYIEPISFVVPRRAETFQSDIYPEAFSGESALTAEAWYSGADADPKMLDMETLYTPDGMPSSTPKTPVSVIATTPAPTKTGAAPPKSTPAPESAKTVLTPPKETPAPTEKRVPSPIHVETTAKVADKIPEIPNPSSPPKPTATTTAAPASIPTPAREPVQTPVYMPPSATLEAPPPTPLDANIVEQLARITSLLEIQNKTLASQDKHIAELTKELDTLKNRVDARGNEESSRKDEIIRKLELELEEARS